jgi:hypothetical protein
LARSRIIRVRKPRAIGRTTKVRFVDKLVAIDRAMKHLGLFERDNRQRDSNIAIQVNLVSSLGRSSTVTRSDDLTLVV